MCSRRRRFAAAAIVCCHPPANPPLCQAYRKLALVKHPDKNPDNPKAADEFQQLQRAYDLLCDKEARAALDQLLK